MPRNIQLKGPFSDNAINFQGPNDQSLGWADNSQAKTSEADLSEHHIHLQTLVSKPFLLVAIMAAHWGEIRSLSNTLKPYETLHHYFSMPEQLLAAADEENEQPNWRKQMGEWSSKAKSLLQTESSPDSLAPQMISIMNIGYWDYCKSFYMIFSVEGQRNHLQIQFSMSDLQYAATVLDDQKLATFLKFSCLDETFDNSNQHLINPWQLDFLADTWAKLEALHAIYLQQQADIQKFKQIIGQRYADLLRLQKQFSRYAKGSLFAQKKMPGDRALRPPEQFTPNKISAPGDSQFLQMVLLVVQSDLSPKARAACETLYLKQPEPKSAVDINSIHTRLEGLTAFYEKATQHYDRYQASLLARADAYLQAIAKRENIIAGFDERQTPTRQAHLQAAHNLQALMATYPAEIQAARFAPPISLARIDEHQHNYAQIDSEVARWDAVIEGQKAKMRQQQTIIDTTEPEGLIEPRQPYQDYYRELLIKYLGSSTIPPAYSLLAHALRDDVNNLIAGRQADPIARITGFIENHSDKQAARGWLRFVPFSKAIMKRRHYQSTCLQWALLTGYLTQSISPEERSSSEYRRYFGRITEHCSQQSIYATMERKPNWFALLFVNKARDAEVTRYAEMGSNNVLHRHNEYQRFDNAEKQDAARKQVAALDAELKEMEAARDAVVAKRSGWHHAIGALTQKITMQAHQTEMNILTVESGCAGEQATERKVGLARLQGEAIQLQSIIDAVAEPSHPSTKRVSELSQRPHFFYCSQHGAALRSSADETTRPGVTSCR